MKFLELNQSLRAKNFAKLWAEDDVLIIIAEEYSKYYKCSSSFTKEVLQYSKKDRRIKHFKNRLKGK